MAATATHFPNTNDKAFGLTSQWTQDLNPLNGNSIVGRFECEAPDLAVFGEIPKQIDGTFYRIMVDPFYPLAPGNPPIEGDGNICAFRIKDGRVDMKCRYVDTERLKLERANQKRMFGLYRNPFTHHPCVRAAVDSTANTSLIYWAGNLLALKESALPYACDPDTLETRYYDPFESPGKTFTAHPKLDPDTNELVCYGYEAKGLGTDDVVTYHMNAKGEVYDEQWVKAPWVGLIHDCAITRNFLILALWPYEADVNRMKAGGQHWEYSPKRPATFTVIPRRPGYTPAGWQPGETRSYHWEHAVLLHTAGAWEEENGKLKLESSRAFYNSIPQFGPPGEKMPTDLKADYVRWELDVSQPNNTKVPNPEILCDLPSEMARIDERFWTHHNNIIFLPVINPKQHSATPPIVPLGLTAYMMVNTSTGEQDLFDPGPMCTVEEPIFIPRSNDAPEGDGWLMGMIQRHDINRSELVMLDTKNFSKPVAIVQLPFRTKGQIHGNWVDAERREDGIDFVRTYGKRDK